MDRLFSCRNCIQNAGQSLLIGQGAGYCLKHRSVIWEPSETTCKYLHRKDLPRFVVDEGVREHAAAFAEFPGLAGLHSRMPVARVPYSEKFVWERRVFDPINQMLAQHHKTRPAWVFVQAMSGGLDGRRSLVHASVIRRYMDKCASWKSSYRFVLGMLQELAVEPGFAEGDLNNEEGLEPAALREEANWDVFFTRLGGIQEYGFHAGIGELMWATDQLDGALVDLDWGKLRAELESKREDWIERVIRQVRDQGAFFNQLGEDEEAGEYEES